MWLQLLTVLCLLAIVTFLYMYFRPKPHIKSLEEDPAPPMTGSMNPVVVEDMFQSLGTNLETGIVHGNLQVAGAEPIIVYQGGGTLDANQSGAYVCRGTWTVLEPVPKGTHFRVGEMTSIRLQHKEYQGPGQALYDGLQWYMLPLNDKERQNLSDILAGTLKSNT